MKKTVALILAGIVAFAFQGCSKINPDLEYATAPDVSLQEKGSWDGNVYKNDSAELIYEKPESWIAATDEELSSVKSAEGMFYDMLCQDPSTGSQISVSHEELLLTTGSITITEDEYIEALAENFYNSGMDVLDRGEVEICGNTYKTVTVYGESEDLIVTQCSMIRKVGNTMISVIAVAFNEDSIDDIMSGFAKEDLNE